MDALTNGTYFFSFFNKEFRGYHDLKECFQKILTTLGKVYIDGLYSIVCPDRIKWTINTAI